MATQASVPNFLFANTQAKSADVNANFDAIYAFINTQIVHRDGLNPFTALPSLPSNPTAANQMTRYQYAKLRPKVYSPTSGTNIFAGSSVIAPPGGTGSETKKWIMEAGSKLVALTAGVGNFAPLATFATAIVACLVSAGANDSISSNTDGHRMEADFGNSTLTNIRINCGNGTGSARVNYILIGY